MAYVVLTNEILQGVLYYVAGAQSVVYNSSTYTTGQFFRGVHAVKVFTYSGSGTQELNEVQELFGAGIEFSLNPDELPVFADATLIKGMSIEFSLNDDEKIVNEITVIKGFSIELLDYPLYAFQITKRIR